MFNTLKICYSEVMPPEISSGINSVNTKCRDLPRGGVLTLAQNSSNLMGAPIRPLPGIPPRPLSSFPLA